MDLSHDADGGLTANCLCLLPPSTTLAEPRPRIVSTRHLHAISTTRPLRRPQLQLNPTVRFLLLGDKRPLLARWPENCAFHRASVADVLLRVRALLGAAPPSLKLDGAAPRPTHAHAIPQDTTA